MKIPKLPDNVKVHTTIWRKIKEISISDMETAGNIVQRIVGLGLDPLPMTDECESETVWNLTKKNVYVKRLKCVDISDYRIFYAYKKSGMVCVYCIVPRSEDTYKKDSWHYQIIKLLYTQWKECQ